MPAIVIYGPQGCGKTLRADDMKTHFKAVRVIDLDELGYRQLHKNSKRQQPIVPADTVALTHDRDLAMDAAERSGGSVMAFDAFLADAGLVDKHAAHLKKLRGG